MMKRLFKFVLYLAVIAFIGISAYAYLGDIAPAVETRTIPVALDNI